MPEPQTLHVFLQAHLAAPLEALQEAFPAGCLMSRANPSKTTRETTQVVAIVPTDPKGEHVVVGRDETADVCLPDTRVSKAHARFHLGEQLLLEDLGSANGTYVNGARLSEGQTVAIEQGTSEVWFADRQFFHFDASALHTYVSHLSTQEQPAFVDSDLIPVAEPPPPLSKAVTQKLSRPDFDGASTAILDDLGGGLPTPEMNERWKSGTTALKGLLPNAERVVLCMALQDDPVTVFDASKGGDPGSTLTVLAGLRSVVNEIKVVLKRSGYELVVYRR
jgi:hypothetical protein